MTDTQTVAAKPPPMTGSERVKLARQRKRKGIMCVSVEIVPADRDALIRIGLLAKADCNNKTAVRNALYDYLEGFLNFQMAPRSNGSSQ